MTGFDLEALIEVMDLMSWTLATAFMVVNCILFAKYNTFRKLHNHKYTK